MMLQAWDKGSNWNLLQMAYLAGNHYFSQQQKSEMEKYLVYI